MDAPGLCQTLRATLSELFECSQAPQGAVRVRTPFLYPDGDVIDVFVEQEGEGYLLTDYGEALGWLRMQSARGKMTERQTRLAQDICRTLGVELERGQLLLRGVEATALSEAVHRLGQAMIRAADIWFTFRTRSVESTADDKTRSVESIADEVDDWLRVRPFEYERGVTRRGGVGIDWTVDYQIVTQSHTALLFLLSGESRAEARMSRDRVFTGCSDLRRGPGAERVSLVSLFDDTSGVWRAQDFALVESVSKIAVWSQPDKFADILITEPEYHAQAPLFASQ